MFRSLRKKLMHYFTKIEVCKKCEQIVECNPLKNFNYCSKVPCNVVMFCKEGSCFYEGQNIPFKYSSCSLDLGNDFIDVSKLTKGDIGRKIEFSDSFALYRGILADLYGSYVIVNEQVLIDCGDYISVIDGKEYQEECVWVKNFITGFRFID